MLPLPEHTDEQKVSLLKKVGVWNSVTQLQDLDFGFGVFHTYWVPTRDNADKEAMYCRIVLEFRPDIVCRDMASNTKFINDVFELIGRIKDTYTPDIKLIKKDQ
jgi:hypothetical protein